jgi:putative Mg2+ transporter-C (MgtC) family protein
MDKTELYLLLKHQFFFDLGDVEQIVRVLVRLAVAAILGGAIGFEREEERKKAGMRTHMLVSMGAALFTLSAIEARMATADVSRVMQGIVAGIGFLGAGTILKLSEQREVRGLTTAASIWLTAAVGMGVGAGLLWPSVISALLALIILFVIHRIEFVFRPRTQNRHGSNSRSEQH